MKFPTKSICALSLAVSGLLLTGCYGQYRGYHAIRANPTPELQSLSERPIDIDRHLMVAGDQTLRMLSEDLGRLFHLDHPSRLTPYPVLYTSGVPR